MNEIRSDEYIDIEGPEEDSIFHQLKTWCVDDQTYKAVCQRNQEFIARVGPLKDERSSVLVSTLLVETSIDELLSAMMPGYKELVKKKDFTFSLKIETARALRIVPSRLLSDADFVRQIRNEFAHNLEIASFETLKELKKDNKEKGKGFLQSLRNRLAKYNPKSAEQENDAQAFSDLAVFVAVGLTAYAYHGVKLNAFIRTKDFKATFKSFCEGTL